MSGKYELAWEADDVRRAIQQAPQTYRTTMRAGLSMMLQEVRKELVETIKRTTSRGGEGNLAASATVLLGQAGAIEGSVRLTAPYARFVDKGRGPGKMPPYDPIELWVHRMGLGTRASGTEREERRERHVPTERRTPRPSRSGRTSRREAGELDREQIIFAIRRKIGRRGTFTPNRPPEFMRKTRRAIRPRLEKLYQEAVDAFVSAVSTPR